MTFADVLNEQDCSCGVEEGRTWFADGNGDEPKELTATFKILQNNNGADVTNHKIGFSIQAEDKDGNIVTAVYDRGNYHWRMAD